MVLKYSISGFVTTGFPHESWVKLGRNGFETQIKSIFHCPKRASTTKKKEKLNEILKSLSVFELDPAFPYSVTPELMGLVYSHKDDLSYY